MMTATGCAPAGKPGQRKLRCAQSVGAAAVLRVEGLDVAGVVKVAGRGRWLGDLANRGCPIKSRKPRSSRQWLQTSRRKWS